MVGSVQNAGRTVWGTFKDIASGTLKGINQVRKGTDEMYAGIRAVAYTVLGIGHATNSMSPPSPGVMQGSSLLQSSIGVIDTAMCIADIGYFTNGRFKQDGILKVVGKISMAFANLGGAVMWFAKLGFYNLGKTALSVGAKLVPGLAGVAFTFFGAESVKGIVNAANKEQRTKSVLEVVACVAEVALITLGIAGVSSIALTVGLGLVAVGCGLTAFLYAQGNAQAMAAKKPVGNSQKNLNLAAASA